MTVGKLAINAKLYRNTGTYNAPVLLEVPLVSDGTLTMTWDEGQADARESRVHQVVKTMAAVDYTFRLKKKPLDASYEALMDLFLSDDAADMFFLDGPKDQEGVRGVRFDAQLFAATEDQSLPNVLYEDMVAKPSLATNPIKAVRVNNVGTLTYKLFGTPDAFA